MIEDNNSGVKSLPEDGLKYYIKDGRPILEYIKAGDDGLAASITTTSFDKHDNLLYYREVYMPDRSLAKSEELDLKKHGGVNYIYFRLGGKDFEDVEYGTPNANKAKPGQHVLTYCKNDENYIAVETYQATFNSHGKLEHFYKIHKHDGQSAREAEHDPALVKRVCDLRIQAIHKAAEISQEQRAVWANAAELLKTFPIQTQPLSYNQLPAAKAKSGLVVN